MKPRHPVTEIAELHDELDAEQAVRDRMAKVIFDRMADDLRTHECGGTVVYVLTKEQLIDLISGVIHDVENW